MIPSAAMKLGQEGENVDQSGNPIPILTSTFLLLLFYSSVLKLIFLFFFFFFLIPLKMVTLFSPPWISRKSALVQHGINSASAAVSQGGSSAAAFWWEDDTTVTSCLNFCHKVA